MSLRDKRCEFTALVAKLIEKINSTPGYEAALNECGRSDEQCVVNSIGEAGRAKVASLVEHVFPALALAILNNGKANGILLSLHRDKLAVDIDLYKNGVYAPETESHRQFGEWWEKQHLLASWGGRFNDANHYSLSDGGRK
jgi:hypothetical protein